MKFKCLFFALSAVMSASWVSADAVDEQTLSKYFPKYNRANQCWVADVAQGTYCMKIDTSKTVDTSAGKQRYILAAGSLYDFTTNEVAGGHANSGNVAMFVLKLMNNKWQVISAKIEINAGAFGQAPTNWTFHQFGPDTYGFLNEHGDAQQGYAGSHYVILTPNGKSIAEHWVGASVSNGGAEVSPSKLNEVESKIKIDRSESVKTGLYPLLITLNGKMGKKNFKNSVHKIPYDPAKKTYVEPKNYPLKDIEY